MQFYLLYQADPCEGHREFFLRSAKKRKTTGVLRFFVAKIGVEKMRKKIDGFVLIQI